jgi:hypothetical protein
MRMARRIEFTFSAHQLSITGQGWSDGRGQGFDSSVGDWFIRATAYGGTDPSSGKCRWQTRTVRGDPSAALQDLTALAAHADVAPAVGAHTRLSLHSLISGSPRGSNTLFPKVRPPCRSGGIQKQKPL